MNRGRKDSISIWCGLFFVRQFEDNSTAQLRCEERKGSVDQQTRKNSEMALLHTTNCAVTFPRLPPFSVLIDDIQDIALGE